MNPQHTLTIAVPPVEGFRGNANDFAREHSAVGLSIFTMFTLATLLLCASWRRQCVRRRLYDEWVQGNGARYEVARHEAQAGRVVGGGGR